MSLEFAKVLFPMFLMEKANNFLLCVSHNSNRRGKIIPKLEMINCSSSLDSIELYSNNFITSAFIIISSHFSPNLTAVTVD